MKNYVLDTNILMDSEDCIEVLRNGGENRVCVPSTVIEELDRLKGNSQKRHQVFRAIKALKDNAEFITVLSNGVKHESNDNNILKEIMANEDTIPDPIFVTNDELLQFKAASKGLSVEPFKDSNPFKSESQRYTGFVNINDGEALERNCFYWQEGRLHYNNCDGKAVCMDYENEVWKVKPRTPYQNAALQLILDDNIDVVSIQSEAGFGKSYLALAAMFHLAFERKLFKKIYIFRPNIEIGQELGFLPGDINDKMYPYFRPMKDLMLKLHEMRPANRVWIDPDADKLELNPKSVEMLPINFLRGMNIDNSIVLIDEVQNLSRIEMRTMLSRMGENVKVICTGDVRQIDNAHLNQDNNGLNWLVKLLKGAPNYGHVVLSGSKSRGPIADLIRERQL